MSDLVDCPPTPETTSPESSTAPVGTIETIRAFRRHHGSAALVTVLQPDGRPVGLLVDSLLTVSTAPPLVSFLVPVTSSRWPAIAYAEHIALHELPAHGAALAARFRRDHDGGFGPEVPWHAGAHGVPLLDAAPVRCVATPQQRIHAGDQVIVVARLEL